MKERKTKTDKWHTHIWDDTEYSYSGLGGKVIRRCKICGASKICESRIVRF